MATPRRQLSLEELEDMEREVTQARFDHAIAALRRRRALRELARIQATPMDERMTEQHVAAMRARRAVLEHERAMIDAERIAQDIEARVILDQEDAMRPDSGEAA